MKILSPVNSAENDTQRRGHSRTTKNMFMNKNVTRASTATKFLIGNRDYKSMFFFTMKGSDLNAINAQRSFVTSTNINGCVIPRAQRLLSPLSKSQAKVANIPHAVANTAKRHFKAQHH